MEKSSQNWRQIKELLSQAMDEKAADREAFIQQAACSDDVKDELRKLIRADNATSDVFESVITDASAKRGHIVSENVIIEQYRIIKLIGQGGMGEVYLAERADKQFKKQVALKLVSSHQPNEMLLKRFKYERQVLATLEHPNIARLLDGGETEQGLPYIVMEYINGIPIDQYCDTHKLSTQERIKLFLSICDAIQYAHRNLIVHRDIKATNILVDNEGNAKLLDFGIAKALEDQDSSLTQSAARVLSPMHASPEQIKGDTITVSTDVYSLGVLLYQLLTGLHPIDGENTTNALQIQQAICEDYPKKPSARLHRVDTAEELTDIAKKRSADPKELVKKMGGDLDNIVMKSLNKEPERRYITVQDLIDDLARYMQQRPVLARPSTFSYKAYKFMQRNKASVLVGTVACLLVFAIAGFSYNTVLIERDTAKEAQRNAEAVSEFLQDVFSSVDPAIARGETVTALELLSSGQQQLTQSLGQDFHTQLVMRRVFANANYALGDTDTAIEQAQLAIDIAGSMDQADSMEIASVKLLQGLIAQDNSQFDEARALYKEARDLIESVNTPPHKSIVEAIHSEAFLEDTLGNHDTAISLYQQAIDMNKALPVNEAYEPGFSETRLTDVLRKEGRYDDGIAIIKQAIATMQSNYQGLHPKLSIAKRQLAMLLKDTLAYDQSALLYAEIIEEQQKLYSLPSMELAITYSEYSLLLWRQDRIDEAFDAASKYMETLDIIHKGKPNALYGAAYNNHAYFLKDIGEYELALESFDKSIEQQDLIGLAQDHFHRSFPLHGKALTFIEMAEYEKAVTILKQVLPMRLQHMDESHLYVTQVKSSLGDALMRLGKLDEAEVYLNDSLSFYTQYQGEDSKEANIVRGFLEELAQMKAQ